MAQFASDTFTGTAGTELSAYSGNWTAHSSNATNAQIDGSGTRLRAQFGSLDCCYYHSGTPASADYSVSADFYIDTANAQYAGICGRLATGADTFYLVQLANTKWQMYKKVTGSYTQLGSGVAQTQASTTSYLGKLEMVGTAIKFYKLGETSASISVTDSAIAAAGKAGFRFDMRANIPQLDNFSGDDVSSSTVTGPLIGGSHLMTSGPLISGRLVA